jgi:hypothetical protein
MTQEELTQFRHFMARWVRNYQSGQRHGQSLFNAMYEVYPDIAEALRGTVNDPFYDDIHVAAAMIFLVEHLNLRVNA